MHDKKSYVVHIRSLKQALHYGLILKKVHRVIQFNKETWLKEYIGMNTELRKQAKRDFEIAFFKLMNNSVFGKTMENVREYRNVKLVTTDKRRNQLVSEPNYHTTKWFSENLVSIEMKKIKVKMNKPVYLGLSILEISKTVIYEFWYDYKNQNIGITHNYAIWIQTVLSLILKQKISMKILLIMLIFHTSNYEVNIPLPKENTKKVIALMKDELGGKIMTELAAIRTKTYSYLMDDGNSDKKAKGAKKYVIKQRLKFIYYKNCLSNNEIIFKSQQRFKS